MFENGRYMTRGVAAEIPFEQQALMWAMIDVRSLAKKLDYLQVFRLSVENGSQKITHSQEKPRYKNEVFTLVETPVTAKIFVLDDGDHSTMMLASEY